jgi:hypothetical protein
MNNQALVPKRDLFPTSYPEVNAILARLLQNVRDILGDQFVGLYIHGSLASGDFNPETSDIDFVVVTEAPVTAMVFSALREMHTRLFSDGMAWVQKLEGAYIPRDDLRRQDPAHAPLPWLGVDGHFALEGLGREWTIQRWILREKGIVIIGPPLKSLIDPINSEELREAVRGNLIDWWSPPFPSPERFESAEYQAYAILTMCRSLFVLEYGRVASKPEAAGWALQFLGDKWHDLIEAAVSWKPGINFNKFNETMRFIYFTLNHLGDR